MGSAVTLSTTICEALSEAELEIVRPAAFERNLGVTPLIISDNGSQFIAKDFKAFVRFSSMVHVKIRWFYPQANGKLGVFHRIIKRESIRSK